MKRQFTFDVKARSWGRADLQHPAQTIVVEVAIDAEEVARSLAARAVVSKSRKASAMGGDIKLSILSTATTNAKAARTNS